MLHVQDQILKFIRRCIYFELHDTTYIILMLMLLRIQFFNFEVEYNPKSGKIEKRK